MVPRDLIPWGTAWSYFRRWRQDGTWQRLHDTFTYVAAHSIAQIERLMTDNAWAYRYSLPETVTRLGAKQIFIRPHCPDRSADPREHALV
jgi:transposase